MKPIIRFNSIVISLTTLVVFGIWLLISKLLLTNPEWFKNPDNNLYNFLGIILTAFMSIGVYRIFLNLCSYLVNNSLFIRKMIFKSSFLEGTWVGFYIGVSGNVRYLIETFEQNFDSVIIRGKSFNELQNFHSTWISDNVNIDVNRGKLSYHYKVESPNETSDHNGIAFFNFERKTKKTAPHELIGFSADLHLSKKCKAVEIKVSDETTIKLEIALQKAKELYETRNTHFFNT